MAVTRAFTNATNFEKRKAAHPLIINGDMAVAQRGTVTGITSPGTYGAIDRFRADIRGGFGVTVAQSTTVPSGKGFKTSLKFLFFSIVSSLLNISSDEGSKSISISLSMQKS